jgi:hypothetical protein
MKKFYKTDPDDITLVYLGPSRRATRHIVCAANKYLVNGEELIICGARHCDPIMSKQVMVLKLLTGNVKIIDQGFIDQYQQWVSREDAAFIVQATKQPLRDYELHENRDGSYKLFSENLY